ncbi:A disintegrin and metalloproteinase with thrombospondin motifs 20 [Nymphon striatum]|nr:A disintegrin and metalloproteinase with thrombospondin motifs 20 [Nymphon striatum]
MLWCEGPKHEDGCLSKHSPWADGTDCGLNRYDPQDSKHQPQDRYYEINPLAQRRKRSFCSVSTFFLKLFFPPKTRFLYQLLRLSRGSVTSPSLCRPIILHHIARQEVCDVIYCLLRAGAVLDHNTTFWCKRGECIRKNYRALTPVNGDWGEWSAYSSCSRSCGGGIAQSERLCDSPKPENGGRYCLGRRMRYKSCNTKECLVESKSFRDVQCEVFNGVNFDLKDIPAHPKWVPKFYTEDSCRLICSVNGTSMYHILKEKVTDGTPCRPDYYDICVNGICVKAGCDHILGSSAKGDMCNVCQGDNSTCRVVSGSFNARYNLVKVIPAGAANLKVEQKGYQGLSKDDNYLGEKYRRVVCTRIFDRALVDDDHCDYQPKPDILASVCNLHCSLKWHIFGESECSSRCSVGIKQRTIKCVQEIDQGEKHPLHDRYCEELESKPEEFVECVGDCSEVFWKLEEWSESVMLPCHDEGTGKRLPDDMCDSSAKPTGHQKCRDKSCGNWRTGEWSKCSQSCGGGYKQRQVKCQDIHHKESEFCDSEKRPTGTIRCNVEACPTWTTAQWSECSVTCGRGTRLRAITCVVKGSETKESDEFCPETKPRSSKKCRRGSCPKWRRSRWSKCSKPCGTGFIHRKVMCVDVSGQPVPDKLCKRRKPRTKGKCNAHSCGHTWKAESWSLCSSVCGRGVSRRRVKCTSHFGKKLLRKYCDSRLKPPKKRICWLRPCNFKSNFNFRLLQPKSCPANGQRDENCACRNDYKLRAGFTSFRKIRLNITTLQVISKLIEMKNLNELLS